MFENSLCKEVMLLTCINLLSAVFKVLKCQIKLSKVKPQGMQSKYILVVDKFSPTPYVNKVFSEFVSTL